ncbi:hypothetical protein FHS44_007943 [Streptosporangium saharense]|uniref:Uncharacterized protein n=1 Tax=Streptosporangium saharense TaxID=1706840 RepID=A0A7W7VS37_9ACTN|nr:hypothetical protein [Streptosporangium saharense]
MIIRIIPLTNKVRRTAFDRVFTSIWERSLPV